MGRTLIGLALMIACAWFVIGCASTETVTLTHVFPPTGVTLEGSRRIQVIGFDGAPASSEQLAMVRQVLRKIEGIRVVSKNPDYWLVTGWVSGYAQSNTQEAKYSSKTGRGFTESHWGGHENTVIQPQVTTSCAMVATFSLVKADDLTPVTIFNVGVYDSDFSPRASRSMGMYEVAFRQSLETKLREVFIPGNRSIQHRTAIPDNAPPQLVAQLGKGGHLTNLTPSLGDFSTREAEGRLGCDREVALTTYFLHFLNQELACTDVDGLKELHAQYLQLVELTQNDTLLEAAARGLARVEEKLRILGHTPMK